MRRALRLGIGLGGAALAACGSLTMAAPSGALSPPPACFEARHVRVLVDPSRPQPVRFINKGDDTMTVFATLRTRRRSIGHPYHVIQLPPGASAGLGQQELTTQVVGGQTRVVLAHEFYLSGPQLGHLPLDPNIDACLNR